MKTDLDPTIRLEDSRRPGRPIVQTTKPNPPKNNQPASEGFFLCPHACNLSPYFRFYSYDRLQDSDGIGSANLYDLQSPRSFTGPGFQSQQANRTRFERRVL